MSFSGASLSPVVPKHSMPCGCNAFGSVEAAEAISSMIYCSLKYEVSLFFLFFYFFALSLGLKHILKVSFSFQFRL